MFTPQTLFKHIGIVGAGSTGAALAQMAAVAGADVLVYDINDTVLRRAFERIKTDLRRQVQQNVLTADQMSAALGRLRSRTSVADLSPCDLVVEAVVEDLRVKRDLLKHLDANTKPATVLATASSALSVSAVGSLTRFPERIIGMHFFHPIPSSPVVEIARGSRTNDQTVLAATDLVTLLGKRAILTNDSPGFIVNRVSAPLAGESLQIAGERIATPEQIDRIMKAVGGYSVGPFEAIDQEGIDTHLAATRGLSEQFFGDSRYRPHPLLQQMVDAGKLGKKSGSGFVTSEANSSPQ